MAALRGLSRRAAHGAAVGLEGALAGGARLPLFPLDRPLFPTQTLQLYIHEPRYLCMFDSMLGEGDAGVAGELQASAFGLLKLRQGQEDAGETAWKAEEVGTVAEVAEVTRLHNGHLNVRVAGSQRFRLAAPPERNLLGYWTAGARLHDDVRESAPGGDVARAALDAYTEFLALEQLGAAPALQAAVAREAEQALEELSAAELSFWLAARLPPSCVAARGQKLLETDDPLWRMLSIANLFKMLVAENAPP